MILVSILFITTLSAAIYFGRRAYVLAGLLADEQDYVTTIETTNKYMYDQIEKSFNIMTEIDRLGAFEAEDESGTTFSLLKQVITELKEEFDGEGEEKK